VEVERPEVWREPQPETNFLFDPRSPTQEITRTPIALDEEGVGEGGGRGGRLPERTTPKPNDPRLVLRTPPNKSWGESRQTTHLPPTHLSSSLFSYRRGHGRGDGRHVP
jgi:hypothetical protein